MELLRDDSDFNKKLELVKEIEKENLRFFEGQIDFEDFKWNVEKILADYKALKEAE